MRVYNTQKDKYGSAIDSYEYLCDRGVSCSGTKLELLIEMKLWNFIAKIINFITGSR